MCKRIVLVTALLIAACGTGSGGSNASTDPGGGNLPGSGPNAPTIPIGALVTPVASINTVKVVVNTTRLSFRSMQVTSTATETASRSPAQPPTLALRGRPARRPTSASGPQTSPRSSTSRTLPPHLMGSPFLVTEELTQPRSTSRRPRRPLGRRLSRRHTSPVHSQCPRRFPTSLVQRQPCRGTQYLRYTMSRYSFARRRSSQGSPTPPKHIQGYGGRPELSVGDERLDRDLRRSASSARGRVWRSKRDLALAHQRDRCSARLHFECSSWRATDSSPARAPRPGRRRLGPSPTARSRLAPRR